MAIEIRGMLPGETDLVLDLYDPETSAPREFYQAIWKHAPGARDEHSRVVFDDGRPVAHQRLHEREMRLGRTAILHGGVGDVRTHPDHRRLGYGRMLLDDAYEYFRGRGMDLAIIFSSVHHFYCNCGYEKCPSVTYSVRTDHTVYSRDDSVHVRWFEHETDLEQVSAVYDAYNARRPLSVVRGVDHWRRQRLWTRRDRPEGFIVAELGGGGELAAYVRGGPGDVVELGRLPGDDGLAPLRQCFEAVMRLAASREIERVSVTAPSDEPLLGELREKFDVTEETRETLLVRFIDLPRLLGKLSGELTERLRTAGISPTAKLAFSAAGHEATLEINSGRVSAVPGIAPGAARVELSGAEMLMMMAGAGGAGGAGRAGGTERPEAGRLAAQADLLSALFGPAGPVYWPADIV